MSCPGSPTGSPPASPVPGGRGLEPGPGGGGVLHRRLPTLKVGMELRSIFFSNEHLYSTGVNCLLKMTSDSSS
jgi:hypothetical protein